MIKINFTDSRMAKEFADKLIKAGQFSVPAPELVSEKHFHLSGLTVYVCV